MRVTSADFIENYGSLSERADLEPVTITTDGRDRLVVISATEYERLTRRDRRVVQPEELGPDELAIIAGSEVGAEHAHLDAELDGAAR